MSVTAEPPVAANSAGSAARTTRRELLVRASGLVLQGTALAVLAGCSGLPAAPSPSRTYRLGHLGAGGWERISAFLRPALDQLGYSPATLEIDIRWAERDDQFPALAMELVNRKVDLIVASNTPATLAAKRATTAIPIVFVGAGDPVGTGLVASLPQPGGNVTGFSRLSPVLSTKRLELLRDLVPGLARVGVLWNPTNADKQLDFAETRAAARSVAIDVRSLEVTDQSGFNNAFQAATSDGVRALLVFSDTLTEVYQPAIVSLAARSRLPAMYEQRPFVEAGGLIAYGPRLPDLYRRAADYVDKILKGAKPAALPVQQPALFDLVVNQRTAQSLGLAIPQSVLLQVTEVLT